MFTPNPTAAVTYLPYNKSWVAGAHEDILGKDVQLLASTDYDRSQMTNKNGEFDVTTRTTIHDPAMRNLALYASEHAPSIRMGQHRGITQSMADRALRGADYEAGASNLNHLVLIKLYNQLMGEQMKFFHLDEMFVDVPVERLQLRMPFRSNPAHAQVVPRRKEYDTTQVQYEEIELYLQKVVTSWEIVLEDKLRALIDPIMPQLQSNDFAMALHREREAIAALEQIGNHYTKNGTGAGRFTATSAPTDNNTARISNPNTFRGTGGESGHSKYDVMTEIQTAANQFMEEYHLPITHYACSANTAMALARNTRTDNNTIFNVEAYRTNGGVRPAPGLANSTMVISVLLPDNVLYATCKPQMALVKAEGPKITQTWEDHTRFVTQSATLDFHQYKCVHEDFPSDFERKFGMIIDLSTASG